MNSLVAVLSTLVAVFFAALAASLGNKYRETKTENAVLWEQVHRYESYIKERVAEDETRERMAIRN